MLLQALSPAILLQEDHSRTHAAVCKRVDSYLHQSARASPQVLKSCAVRGTAGRTTAAQHAARCRLQGKAC
jgi:hypothetical protein